MGARIIFALIAALALLACGGSDKKYVMPVDSPARPFVAPEADELVEADEGGWDLDGDEGGAVGDTADSDGDADAEPPPAKTPKPAPTTVPAKTTPEAKKPAVAPAKSPAKK